MEFQTKSETGLGTGEIAADEEFRFSILDAEFWVRGPLLARCRTMPRGYTVELRNSKIFSLNALGLLV